MRQTLCLASTLTLALLAGCTPPRAPAPETPLFGNLGPHHRKVTTKSEEAQPYFDQGLILTFAFNHDEAIRSFREVAALDPSCAMAWWGIALANGPHINNAAMDEAQSKAAWEALQKARPLARKASEVERALIEALGQRYADPPPMDRKPLDGAYAEAMRTVWQAHQSDADVGTLFAEAMMDLRPWDLWTQDQQPQPGTEEILATIEAVLRLDPEHPGANHLYIHAMESSSQPERALPSADRLRDLVPGAGHLVHMPAHIYCRLGRWDDAAQANLRAIETDREYRRRSPNHGFYHIYMAHNHHFLSWAAMMQGRSTLAIQAARDMLAGIPPEFVEGFASAADGYMIIALEAMMRFGRWEDVLQEPVPPPYLPITAAYRLYTRAVALTATDRVEEAKIEQKAFQEAVAKVTEDMFVGNNSAQHVLGIASNQLTGEIAYREGKIDDAVAALREAVALEDALRYDEAPDWLQPVRHTLGGVLLGAGRLAEAEAVYREDLARNPENGWALFGLTQCLKARQVPEEARAVQARFDQAWAKADVQLTATCFCLSPN